MNTRHAALLLAVLLLLPPASLGCGKTIGETLDDATISTRVKTALLNDDSVPAQIDVSTSAGIVTLSGEVRSQAEADRAVQDTRKVAGVRDVKNQLTIRSGEGRRPQARQLADSRP